MKKMTKTLWVFLLMLGCLLGTGHVLAATSTQPTGAGTQGDPYQISTTDELFWFAGLVNGTLTGGTTKNTAACAKLTADITIPEGNIWTPIGSKSAPYTGTFDGADYNIDNLVVNNSSADYQGFVGYLGTGGSIKNLTLGTNCSVTGRLAVGGICGYNNGIITDCANSGAVSGSNNWVGGICGYNKGSVTDCANSGAVRGSNKSYDVGGICGQNHSTITDCTNNGAVEGGEYYTSGICGRNYGTITDCANNGKVDGNRSVGGVCGCNANGGTITDCANSSAVTGYTWVGSVCGDNIGTIIDSYWLEGTANAGIGYNRGNGIAISKTADEFASGEVCWLLNGESDEAPVWFQTLGAEGDAVPVLDQTHGTVYAVKDCPNSEPTSYNNEGSSIGEHNDIDGDNLCDHCGGMMTSNNAPEQVESIYQLDSYNDLIWFAALVNGTFLDGTQNSAANAVLTADITIPEGVEWTPMAASAVFGNSASTVAETTDKSYSGVFDGAGHKISNLNIRVNAAELTSGLFGAVTGTIKNLGIVNASFNNNGLYDGRFGAICGLLVKDGQTTTEALVQNCFVINSSIKTKNRIAGAIVGGNYGGTIANCYECGNTVEGHSRIGHLVGDNQNDAKTLIGNVLNCYSDNVVVGDKGGNVTNSGVKDAEEFASGEVCWLLNGESDENPVWFQTLDEGGDAAPVLDRTRGTVYVVRDCPNSEMSYNNQGPSQLGEHTDINGDNLCDHCGGMMTSNNAPEQVESIYQLDSYNDLIWFAALVNGTLLDTPQNSAANAMLTANITIPEALEWTPIGSESNAYCGTFDGNNHTISGLNITNVGSYSGMFGKIVNGTVKNLTIAGHMTIAGNAIRVGGLVGFMDGGTLSGIISKMELSAGNGGSHYGGIVGSIGYNGQNLTTLERCIFSGNFEIQNNDCLGGIAGYAKKCTIRNCANLGILTVTGTSDNLVGGIFAYCNDSEVKVENCYNSGLIKLAMSNSMNSGALFGGVKGGAEIGDCFWLEGSCNNSKGYGYQENSQISCEKKTFADFGSGAVAVLLQGDQTELAWGQTIGTDDYPVLTTDEAKRVYAAKMYNGTAEPSDVYAGASGFIMPEGSNAVAVIEPSVAVEATGTNVIVKDGDAYTCANLVLTDGADFYTPVTFTAGKATYSRILPETSTWGTIVLPFEATTTDASLYEATDVVDAGSEESILAVQPLTGGALEAYTPALFQSETAGTTVTFSASEAEVAATADADLTKTIGGGYTLTGSLSTISALSEGDLFIAKDKFWSVGTTNKVGMQAFRAYIGAPEAGPAQVNALRILVGDATSIRQALSDGTLPVDVYNLQGVQLRQNVARDAALEGLPAGIYIVGGKKVVKK